MKYRSSLLQLLRTKTHHTHLTCMELQGKKNGSLKGVSSGIGYSTQFPKMRTVPLRSQQLFLKFGPRVGLTEAVTSEFIAKRT